MPDSSDVSMPCWPGVLVGDLLLRLFQNFRAQDTGTLSFGHLRVGVPLFSFCFLVPLAFLSPLCDASSPRTTRLFRSSALTLLSLGLCFCDCGHTFFLHVMSPSGLTAGLLAAFWPPTPEYGRGGERASARPPVVGGGGF